MNNIHIFSDSTCDLNQEILEKNNISIVPLYVVFDNKTFKDGFDITPKELYEKVDKLNTLPKTSAPSPADFYNSFKPVIDNGDTIIYIGLSSKLSSTIQNAKLAARQFEEGKVKVIDSLNLSTGIGLLVLKAVDYVNLGMSSDEIVKKIEAMVPNVRKSFVINTLDYLYKGGRCNSVQNFIGSVFKIKPIVKVINGGMILGQKPRGKRKKAIDIMLNDLLKNNIDNSRIIIAHSMDLDNALYIKNQIEKEVNVKDIVLTTAGCVICSHCGPKTVSICYCNK
ncbi:DegV family protein [Clostridiisalibacter paucivorans]|uniref:DegV family protein n=1 Tax=Clostridiisalibacter paucivorans TaxID=408753 RepID=UPI000479ED40|nr:DegV family protein [Clostridiisalibacter paucivorans]